MLEGLSAILWIAPYKNTATTVAEQASMGKSKLKKVKESITQLLDKRKINESDMFVISD